jgi:hypothetical protein
MTHHLLSCLNHNKILIMIIMIIKCVCCNTKKNQIVKMDQIIMSFKTFESNQSPRVMLTVSSYVFFSRYLCMSSPEGHVIPCVRRPYFPYMVGRTGNPICFNNITINVILKGNNNVYVNFVKKLFKSHTIKVIHIRKSIYFC